MVALGLVACGGPVDRDAGRDGLQGTGANGSGTPAGPSEEIGTTGVETGEPIMLPPPAACATGGRFDVVQGAQHMFGIAYSPDGAAMAAGSEGPSPNAILVEADDGAVKRSLPGHGNATYAAAFSPDGKVLATGGVEAGQVHSTGVGSDIVKLWDVSTGQLLRTLPATCGFYAINVEFSHDGSLLVTAGYHGPIEVWRVADGTRVLAIPYETTVYTARFSPDDSLLATAGMDGVVTIWRVADGHMVHELRAHRAAASDAAFSPDGTELATTSNDKTAIIWSVEEGVPTGILRGYDANITHGAWIDKDRIVTNDWKGSVMLWSRGANGRFGPAATCAWSTMSQSVGLALSPDRKWLSATGTSSNGDEPGIWTWPL